MLKILGKVMRFLLWFAPLAGLFAIGFLLAGKYDVAINEFMYKPENLYGILMEAFGWYPAFLPTLFGLALLAGTRLPLRKQWQRLAARGLAVAAMLLGYGLAFRQSGIYLTRRGLLDGSWNWLQILLLTLAIELVFITLIVGIRVRPATRLRMLFFTGFATVYMVLNQGVVNLFKLIWQRTRFDDMLAAGPSGLQHFTPFTQPGGFGGSSFPSGHVANAAGIFVLIILCDLYAGWRENRGVVRGGCWVYIVAMAVARILIGRHFLSDTLAAAGIVALLFYVLHHNPFYNRYLLKTLRRAHLADIGELHDI